MSSRENMDRIQHCPLTFGVQTITDNLTFALWNKKIKRILLVGVHFGPHAYFPNKQKKKVNFTL
jgi:hypothetical protein